MCLKIVYAIKPFITMLLSFPQFSPQLLLALPPCLVAPVLTPVDCSRLAPASWDLVGLSQWWGALADQRVGGGLGHPCLWFSVVQAMAGSVLLCERPKLPSDIYLLRPSLCLGSGTCSLHFPIRNFWRKSFPAGASSSCVTYPYFATSSSCVPSSALLSCALRVSLSQLVS